MAGMSKEAGEAARLAIGTFSRGPPRRRMAIEEVCMSPRRHVALCTCLLLDTQQRKYNSECQRCHIVPSMPTLRELFLAQCSAIEECQIPPKAGFKNDLRRDIGASSVVWESRGL